MPTYPSQGIIGWRTSLLRGGLLSTDPFVAFPELMSVTPGNPDTEEIDFTHLDSPQRRREFKAGFTDGGTVEFEMNMRFEANVLNAVQASILNDRVNGLVRFWEIRWYENVDVAPVLLQTVQFQGFVKTAAPSQVGLTDPQKIAGSIRTSGGETWTPALA